MFNSTEGESSRRIAKHGNACGYLSNDNAARANRDSITNNGSAGDDAVGMNGDEITNAGTSGDRAMTVDLAPTAYLSIMAYDGVFLDVSEFSDLHIDRNSYVWRNDAAMS